MSLRSMGVAGLFAIALLGCASSPNDALPPSVAVVPKVSIPDPVSASEQNTRQLKEAAAELAGSSIYFDYDSAAIKGEYKALLQQKAALLKRHPRLSVSLEGNTDDRGSSEYNLSLGQKRAEAVRQALMILGVSDSKIEAVSFGKERQKAICPEEKCRSQNRRVDFSGKAP